MFARHKVRTGIDLGSHSVKLVRGEGRVRLERITQMGIEPWGPVAEGEPEARAAAALQRLLTRTKLGRHLGRIAVAVGGEQISLREVRLPALSEQELRQALPYEARKHLPLEEMQSPVIDFQFLGMAGPIEENGSAVLEEPSPSQIRVLLAAVPAGERDFPVRVLGRLGLEPEVVDLEPLAALNALLASEAIRVADGKPVGLLDLGDRHATLHLTSGGGGLVSRQLSEAGRGATGQRGRYRVEDLVEPIRETLTFYRGRYRREVVMLFLIGGQAGQPKLATGLASRLGQPVVRFDPFPGLFTDQEQAPAEGHRFAVAVGLCRWWDRIDV